MVGEIGDVKQTAADVETQRQIYSPVSQTRDLHARNEAPGWIDGTFGSDRGARSIAARAHGGFAARGGSFHRPAASANHVQSMEQVVSEGQASRRFNTVLISSFAIAAVLLALMGIYSVIAFSAALRTHELAIGCGAWRTTWQRAAAGAGLGREAGAGGSRDRWSGSRFSRRGCFARCFLMWIRWIRLFWLWRLFPFSVLALAASIVPARRAASIEPMQALHME